MQEKHIHIDRSLMLRTNSRQPAFPEVEFPPTGRNVYKLGSPIVRESSITATEREYEQLAMLVGLGMGDNERIGTGLGLSVKWLLFFSGHNSYADSAKGLLSSTGDAATAATIPASSQTELLRI